MLITSYLKYKFRKCLNLYQSKHPIIFVQSYYFLRYVQEYIFL